MRAGKKFSGNEVVVADAEDYFEGKNKAYDQNEKLEDRYNLWIVLDGKYVGK